MNKNQNVRRVLSLLFVMVMLVCMTVVGSVVASAEEAVVGSINDATVEVKSVFYNQNNDPKAVANVVVKYNGEELVLGTDYKVSCVAVSSVFDNNDKFTVTVTGIGNYDGAQTLTFDADVRLGVGSINNKTNVTYYPTFDDAWAAMLLEKQQVEFKILNDISLNHTYTLQRINANATYVFDASTYKITGEVGVNPLFVIEEPSRVIVKNITIVADGDVFCVKGGILNIQASGTTNQNTTIISNNGSVIDLRGGKVEIVGGPLLVANGDESAITTSDDNTGSVTISKFGNFEKETEISAPNADAAIEWSGNGSLNISYGEISGETAIITNGGSITINGGTLSGDTAIIANGGNITIEGGTLEAPILAGENVTIEASGAEYEVVPAVVSVNGNLYATWQQAVDAKEFVKGASIKLLEDVELPKNWHFPGGNTYTLDLNGNKLTVLYSANWWSNTLTISDTKGGGLVDASGDFIMAVNSTLYIEENVNFNGTLRFHDMSARIFVGDKLLFSGTDKGMFDISDTPSFDSHNDYKRIKLTISNNASEVTLINGVYTLANSSDIRATVVTVEKNATIVIPKDKILTVDPDINVTLKGVVEGDGTVVVSSLEHFQLALTTGVKNIKVLGVITLPENYIAEFNGKTVTGTILGTVRTQGGLWITAEGFKMIGVGAEYYATEDAIVTVAPTLLTVESGEVTLAQSWRTLQGQNIVVAEGATFVVPEDMTFTVYNNTNVTVKGTLDCAGKVVLLRGATLQAAGDVNVESGEADMYLIKNSKYMLVEGATINAQLVLGSTINVNVSATLDGFTSHLTVYINGNKLDGTLFTDIAAKEMTEEFTVTVKYDDVYFVGSNTFTVKEIAVDTMAKYPEYTALLTALLNYGAEAQKSFNYNNTDDKLANAGVAENATHVDLTEEKNNYTDEDNSYYGASVNLKNELQFNFKFFADMVSGAAKAVVTIGNKTITVYADDFGDNNGKKGNDRELVVVTVNVAAAQANEVMYCTFYDENGNAITTAGDSLLSYCVRAWAGLSAMDADKLAGQTCGLEFYQALANYVVAAHGYATTENN